ncbi:MAG: carbohydrate ABC transporter permease [Armatimonadota bacterium]|nr:carbohydrate ABC transporter permease [Armatimonadota bacterium]MDR7519874.1 carbohydrate ABC transporter permease [Armatimonadota bacterium]MDR7550540.1 carbohydrate ABC transporter permease [Armatimonadota bacterium]
MSRRRLASLVAYGLLAAIIIVYLFPFFWMVSTAVKSRAELYRYPPTVVSAEPSTEAFASVLRHRGYTRLLANSLVVSLAAVAGALAASLLIAYPLTRMPVRPGFRRGLLGWILSLRFLPPIVVVVPWFDIVRGLGLYDTRQSLVLLYTVFSLPFVVWMLKGFLAEIPMEIEEAALVDGATRLRAFFRILLPQLAPALLAGGVITFALTWSEFMFAFILTASPSSQTFSIGVASLVTQFEIIWNDMAAAGTISALVPVVLLLLGRRYVITALTFGVIREKG